MVRFCASCGTEVDDTAVFCPTCGQAIDQATEVAIPPAPAWPARMPEDGLDDQLEAGPPPPAADAAPRRSDVEALQPAAAPYRDVPAPIEAAGGPAPVAPPPPPPPRAPGVARSASRPGGRPGGPAINVPLTRPDTLSAWLIGIGALIGAIGALVGLFRGALNPIDLLLLVTLLGVAATVFLGASLPAIPHLRLGTLVVVLIALGVALDRIGFGSAGIGALLLLLGTAVAAIGAIIIELGRDQPMGVPGG